VLPRVLKRFGRSQDGATAIEFGLVALPFFMLLAALVEMALLLWTSQVLEEGVAQASRSLLTGQSQSLYKGSATANTDAFRNAVCGSGTGLIDCSKLKIDVRTHSSFAAAQSGTGSVVSGGALNTAGFGYSQPQPNQIVVVRAVLEYPLFFTQWSSALADLTGGKRAIVASSAFRTEPFTIGN
jgi:pilus assembly protein Flp/PilA